MIIFTAGHSDDDLERWMQEDMQEWFDEITESYKRAGKVFVDRLRAKTKSDGGFGNITWNLRSSIGYLLLFDGEIVDTYFPKIKGGTEGEKTGLEYAQEIALLVNEGGLQLIIVAGMGYASFVEDNDIDVLTHASKGFSKDLLAEFKR